SRTRSRLTSQDCRRGAAEIFAVVNRADSGRDAELDIGYLAVAAFAANLPYGFDDVQHTAGGRRLAAVDHAAAGLDRQIAFECEVGILEKGLVVAPAEAEIFDLNHDDGNIVVIEIQTADIFVRDARHLKRPFTGMSNSGDQRVGAIA